MRGRQVRRYADPITFTVIGVPTCTVRESHSRQITRATQLCDRRRDEVSLDEVERISI
jgi:hypothetical protein